MPVSIVAFNGHIKKKLWSKKINVALVVCPKHIQQNIIITINSSSLSLLAKHIASRGGEGSVDPLPKIFVMRGPINLRFSMNILKLDFELSFNTNHVTIILLPWWPRLIKWWWPPSWINFQFLRFCLKLRDIIRNE